MMARTRFAFLQVIIMDEGGVVTSEDSSCQHPSILAQPIMCQTTKGLYNQLLDGLTMSGGHTKKTPKTRSSTKKLPRPKTLANKHSAMILRCLATASEFDATKHLTSSTPRFKLAWVVDILILVSSSFVL
jgi:hypothetical protein